MLSASSMMTSNTALSNTASAAVAAGVMGSEEGAVGAGQKKVGEPPSTPRTLGRARRRPRGIGSFEGATGKASREAAMGTRVATEDVAAAAVAATAEAAEAAEVVKVVEVEAVEAVTPVAAVAVAAEATEAVALDLLLLQRRGKTLKRDASAITTVESSAIEPITEGHMTVIRPLEQEETVAGVKEGGHNEKQEGLKEQIEKDNGGAGKGGDGDSLRREVMAVAKKEEWNDNPDDVEPPG